jgi:hypothetical protein
MSCIRVIASLFFLVALAQPKLAGAPVQRTLKDIPGARESLLRIVSPKFYQSLLISPVEGWIVVRGQLAGTRVFGTKIVHSELSGAYDQLATDLANNLQVLGFPRIELDEPNPSILVHVLVYRIADGTLAVSFAHFDGSGGSQMRYYGAAWMAVEKPNHLWVTIEPQRLAPHEQRGPRTYTLAVESSRARANLPRAIGFPLMRSR